MGFRNFLSWFVSMLAEGLLLAGRYEDAAQQVERAMSLARECSERRVEARLYLLAGDLAAYREPSQHAGAQDQYSRALVLATDIGARPLIAECHFVLGKLSTGSATECELRTISTTAIAMFREMGMEFWLKKAAESASNLNFHTRKSGNARPT